jgi:hypothetical protein
VEEGRDRERELKEIGMKPRKDICRRWETDKTETPGEKRNRGEG